MLRYRDDFLLLAGRVAYAALFIPDGLRQLFDFTRFAASLGRDGLPLPQVVAGLALIAGLGAPFLILIGYEVCLGSLLLGLFCIAASLTAHRYWDVAAAQQNSVMLQFYKNMALAGGLTFLVVSGPGKWSLQAICPSLTQWFPRRSMK